MKDIAAIHTILKSKGFSSEYLDTLDQIYEYTSTKGYVRILDKARDALLDLIKQWKKSVTVKDYIETNIELRQNVVQSLKVEYNDGDMEYTDILDEYYDGNTIYYDSKNRKFIEFSDETLINYVKKILA
jgi:esterase/lipase superfamily enzyme